jgi:hypothetical protein
MNFKKLMIAVVAVVVVIAIYKFATRVDHTDPVKVATGFTKAMKNKNTSGASKYYAPDQAAAWLEKTDNDLSNMKTGATDRFYDRIPAAPDFAAPVTAAGKTKVISADKSFWVEIAQIGGKWYVTGTDFAQ